MLIDVVMVDDSTHINPQIIKISECRNVSEEDREKELRNSNYSPTPVRNHASPLCVSYTCRPGSDTSSISSYGE